MTALAGHHAAVTGGGRGIGRAVAAALTGAGAAVTIFGRDAASLKNAVAGNAAAGFETADVTDSAAVQAAFANAVRTRGPISILVANAGAAESAPFEKISPDTFRRMFEVNTLGVVHAVQAVLPDMLAHNAGRIVVVASTAGLKGYPYVSAYVAAKHATVGLVRALALEIAKRGVTVNALCPGYTDTDLVAESLDRIVTTTGRTKEDALKLLLRDTPAGRLIAPEEVAAAALFLCSPQASGITGAAFPIAGGEI